MSTNGMTRPIAGPSFNCSPSPASITAMVPSSAAAAAMAATTGPRRQCRGTTSKMIGIGSSKSGGGVNCQLTVAERQAGQLPADVHAGVDVLAAVDAVARRSDDFRHIGPH